MSLRIAHWMALGDLNASLHARVDERALLALEAITALDIPAARTHWDALTTMLAAHQQDEESLVLPVYERTAPFDRGGAVELFIGEHQVLRRVLDQAVTILDSWTTTSPSRRDMVLRFEHFSRLRHVLEHHTLREQTHLYARVETFATEEDRARIVAAFCR